MLIFGLTLLAGIIGGAVAGGVISWHLYRRRILVPGARGETDALVEQQIDAAARQWAAAQGRPAAAPLMARKLRLVHRLNQRRRRGWSS